VNEQRPGWPAGLATALICAALLIGTFAIASAPTPMPPAERWAALTTFALLALATTLQGSIGVYDSMGRVVRRDLRSLAALLGLLPALYAAYSLAVNEFSLSSLVIAIVFVSLPAVALAQVRGSRTPTALDLVAALYLILSLDLHLLPGLALPQQGGLVGFFALAATPMITLLLAARGWPGLGFSWFLSGRDLRATLAVVATLALPVLALAFGLGLARAPASVPGPGLLFERAIFGYFFTALPVELLYRGVLQNAFERLLRERSLAPARAGQLAIGLVALLSGLAHLNDATPGWPQALLAALIAVGAGYAYQRTGKVTASAIVPALLLWLVGVFQ
jgi:membrane protease YdiL (CAAX protease family)